MSNETIWFESDLTCIPLDSLKQIQEFLFEPPAWRTLCEPLRPHSDRLIRNRDLNTNFNDITLERPQNYCHFDADKEKVTRFPEKELPRTLVCHDMANGYHDDSAIDGTCNSAAYTFYNWSAVDIFCYFSHHLVTVPPLSWINVAHHHGVKVIGTLITEWAEGAEFWNKVLSSETDMQNTVSALVTIAKTLKFEGWLLNVENKVAAPDKLLEFVKQLHTMLHEEVPGAVLIWYDSVTSDGSLNWQNKLNDRNRMFFDACDGIFTNYSWTEQDVTDSVAAAGERLHDLYIGVDVWGRNFYGGGMFNTQKAVRYINSKGCSMAIFAPAWTHEAMDHDEATDLNCVMMGDKLPTEIRFLLRDRALWNSLWPYLNTRVPCLLPFKTSFCRGLGKKRRMYGEVLSNGPWYNLRHMQYQPNSIHGGHSYLLSTAEKLKKVTRYTVRDVRGIMKYRQSLLDLNKMLQEENELENASALDDKDKEGVSSQELDDLELKNRPRQDSMTAINDADNKDNKIKSVFRNLFGIKKTKVEFKNEETDAAAYETAEQSSGPEPEEDTATSMSLQQIPVTMRLSRVDPLRMALAFIAEERECLEQWFDDCYIGGTCLRINPSDHIMGGHRTVRLFHTDFTIPDTLVLCFVAKNMPGFKSQYLSLWLDATSAAGKRQRLVLVGRYIHTECNMSTENIIIQYPVPPAEKEFKDLQSYLVVNEPDFYVPITNCYGWKVFYFQLKIPGARVWTIAARTGENQGSILLGHLGLCARDTHVHSQTPSFAQMVHSRTLLYPPVYHKENS